MRASRLWSVTSQSDSPCPRSSYRMIVTNRPRSCRKCCQTGLSQSCWRWLSQQVETSIGGPVPETAYAIRTPSGASQNRICWAASMTRG